MDPIDLASLPDPTGIYRVLQPIGFGSYGTVYRGRNVKTGWEVAIKVMDIPKKEEGQVHREIKLLKKFSNHENMVTFHGAFLRKSRRKKERDKLWLVMEFCSGGTISDLQQGIQMKEDWIAYICREMLKGLAQMHTNNVIHCDVKGLNVMLTDKAEVKLVDFGLSSEGARCDVVTGTPQYMAPEVLSCLTESKAVYDYRSDVWSCGITAIEMAEGDPPYIDKGIADAITSILQLPSPRLRSDKWSQNFVSFVDCCLKKNYKERLSAEQLLQHPFLRHQPNERRVQFEIQKHIIEMDEWLEGVENIKSKEDMKSKEDIKSKEDFNLAGKQEAQQLRDQLEELCIREPDRICEEEKLKGSEAKNEPKNPELEFLMCHLNEERVHLRELKKQAFQDHLLLLAGKRQRLQLTAPSKAPLLQSSPFAAPTHSPTATPSRLQRWLRVLRRWFGHPTRG